MNRIKLEDLKAITPQFINMVVNEMQGEPCVGDMVKTGWGSSNMSTEAARQALRQATSINDLQATNQGFLMAMCNSSHVQNTARNMLGLIGAQGTNEARYELMVNFVVQAMLLGIRLGEHLHDKKKSGLIH